MFWLYTCMLIIRISEDNSLFGASEDVTRFYPSAVFGTYHLRVPVTQRLSHKVPVTLHKHTLILQVFSYWKVLPFYTIKICTFSCSKEHLLQVKCNNMKWKLTQSFNLMWAMDPWKLKCSLSMVNQSNIWLGRPYYRANVKHGSYYLCNLFLIFCSKGAHKLLCYTTSFISPQQHINYCVH